MQPGITFAARRQYLKHKICSTNHTGKTVRDILALSEQGDLASVYINQDMHRHKNILSCLADLTEAIEINP